MTDEQYDRIQDQKTLVEIAKTASEHWSDEILQQISYTIRRMNAEIRVNDTAKS
jgi:hypothetical protein